VAGASLRRHFAIQTPVLLTMPAQGRVGPPSDHFSALRLGAFARAFQILLPSLDTSVKSLFRKHAVAVSFL